MTTEIVEKKTDALERKIYALNRGITVLLSMGNDPKKSHKIWKTRALDTLRIKLEALQAVQAKANAKPFPLSKRPPVAPPLEEFIPVPNFAKPFAKPFAKKPADDQEQGSLAGFLEGSDGTLPEKLPPPPMQIFSDNLCQIINEVSTAKSVPPDMIVAALIGLASCCIGRARGVVYRSDWAEFANLYILLIAETGSGKSHAFDYVFKDVKKTEELKKNIYKAAREKYQEDVAAHKKSKDPNKPAPVRPVNVQYLLDDSTIEAAVERLEDNPRGMFWAVDEVSGFFASLDKYNKSGNDGKRKLLSAWDAKTWSVSRKSKDGISEEKYIARAAIGLFGGIQPHLVTSLFTYDDVKQGWPQRFLYVRAIIDKPMKLPTPEISAETDALVERVTKKLLSLDMLKDAAGIPQTGYLRMSPEAKVMFEGFSNLMQQETFQTEAIGYAAKMSRMVIRLALILHFLEWAAQDGEDPHEHEIEYETMMNATVLMNWLATHTEKVRQNLPVNAEGKPRARAVKNEAGQEKRKQLMEFVAENKEYCSEFRSAADLIARGLGPWKTAGVLGRYLSEKEFPKDGTAYTEYKLYPLPARF